MTIYALTYGCDAFTVLISIASVQVSRLTAYNCRLSEASRAQARLDRNAQWAALERARRARRFTWPTRVILRQDSDDALNLAKRVADYHRAGTE